MKKQKGFLVLAGITFLMFAVAVGGMVMLTYYTTKWACDDYSQVTGKQTKMTLAAGCYVKDTDGEFYHYDEYKNRLVAQGRFKN